MPEGTDANVGYLIAAALATIVVLGAYAVSVASRLSSARSRRTGGSESEPTTGR